MNNTWVYLSIICALCLATSDGILKKYLKKENELLFGWFRFLYSLPLLYTAYYISMSAGFEKEGILEVLLKKEILIVMVIALPLEITATILYTKAIRLSPLSLSVPFLSLTPMFLMLFSVIFLHESISVTGILGIMLIVLGSYCLNIGDLKKGICAPFRSIFKEKGAIFMLITALIYSITASLVKHGVNNASVLSFSAIYYTIVTIALAPIVFFVELVDSNCIQIKKVLRQSILPSIFFALMLITFFIALGMTNVAYVVSIKRLSLLISVVYGYMFFNEHGIVNRFAGASLMFLGFILIVNG